MSPPPSDSTTPPGLLPWLQRHFEAILFGWFWFGMALCGLLAPPERVVELDSGLVTEGWHLSVMACVLGGPVLVGYWLRMSGRWKPRGAQEQPGER